jgi:hypothetical protein
VAAVHAGVSGFRVSGFLVSGFHGFIGVGIGIGIGIDCFTTEHNRLTVSPPHNLTAFEVAGFARISVRQPCDAGADGPKSGAARWQGGFPEPSAGPYCSF